MSKEKIEQKVSLEEAKEQVKKVCRRLALLHLSYAKTIINELGEEKGKKLVLKAIKDYGIRIGGNVREAVKVEGKENNPENYKEDLPLYGMHEKTEKLNKNRKEIIRSYGCVMGELWRYLGEEQIGRLYCYVDPAKYMAYNPKFALVHKKSIPDGHEYCEFEIRMTTAQEQEDFLDNKKDWSYIDHD
jgi:hypothetical protein